MYWTPVSETEIYVLRVVYVICFRHGSDKHDTRTIGRVGYLDLLDLRGVQNRLKHTTIAAMMSGVG